MTLIHVSGPTELPVSVAEAKLHTRIDADEEDILVEGYILSALEEIERKSGIAYMPQTWRWVGDAFPASGEICLSLGPVTEVTSVVYFDADDAEQTLDVAEYRADTFGKVGRVILAGSAWPSTYEREDAVSIEFTAGRGNVPPSVREAIMSAAARKFRDREGKEDSLGPAATTLMSIHRRIVF